MENSTKNTIIDVIPLTRMSLARQQSFSYLHSEKVPFGSLVSVPLFRREVRGITIANRDDFFRFGNIKLKKINKILDEKLITEKQLELAEFISNYYICPLGIVLKFFVTKKTKSKNKKQETENKELKKIKLTMNQRLAVNSILKNNETLLICGNEKVEIYLELINKIIESEKQVLLLVPEVPLAYQALDAIKEYFNEKNITLFHSKLTGGELYANYQKIKSGEAKIIIGTRQASFAPFEKLGLIIVDEEQDISYKQWDMNPRYSAVKAAEELSRLYDAKLLFSSAAPSIENYYNINKKHITKNTACNKTEIIDLRKEGWNKDGKKKKDILISKRLEAEIGWTLKNNKQTFLFVNRRGMSNFSICTNCKEVFRCPRCERALIYDRDGSYRCLHCNFKTDIFAKCPKCKGTEFRNIGTGNQAVEREIKKMFSSAKTKLVDFESLKNKNDQQKLFKDIKDKKYDILIGTQTALKGWDIPHLSLIGVVNADEFINFTDFNSDERSFQTLIKIAEKIKNNKYGKLIIQTYNTEHPVIKVIAEPNLEKFYDEELQQRKSLKYPPFYRIIKLIMHTQSSAKMEKESSFIFGRLEILSQENKNISIFEPFIPKLSKIRDKFRKQIIIKLSSREIPKELEKTLKNLGSDWIIDIDPINVN